MMSASPELSSYHHGSTISVIPYGVMALRALEAKGHLPPVLGGKLWGLFTQRLRLQDQVEFGLRSARAHPGSVGQAFLLFTEEVLWKVRETSEHDLAKLLAEKLPEDPIQLHAEACRLLGFAAEKPPKALSASSPSGHDRILELPGGAGRGALKLLLTHSHLRAQSNLTLFSPNPIERALMAFAVSLVEGDLSPSPVLETLPVGAHYTYALDWGESAPLREISIGKRIQP